MSVTVVTKKSTVTFADAKIQLQTRPGYLSNEWLDDGAVYVTAPLDPPNGVELTKTRVPWAKIKRIEILEWGAQKQTKARLTTLDGKISEVLPILSSWIR